MKNKEDLINERRRLSDEIHKIENKERRDENAKLVGKFFKYRNNYSCPEKNSDYWFLYSTFTKQDSVGYLRELSFQTDKYGDGSFKVEKFSSGPLGGSVEISKKEFNAALKRFQKRVMDL